MTLINSISFVFLVLFYPTICKHKNMIYILQWSRDQWSFPYMEIGQTGFISRNCTYRNCFFTNDTSYFKDITKFDALLFNVLYLPKDNFSDYFPQERSEHQLYVFSSIEPAALYPLDEFYDEFFNVTWTYKFNSDVYRPYVQVKNRVGEVIGPAVDMKWLPMKELGVNKRVVEKLKNKSKAAVWVVSHCDMRARFYFFMKLKKELQKYGLSIDVYGVCGMPGCPRLDNERNGLVTNCSARIERDYYFYLAFENSVCEDYVSEKIMHGLKHYAVPIVYGGANYSRFLPDGTYLDAMKLGARRLAYVMHELMNDTQRYYEYFKWHGYYEFFDTAENGYKDTVCELCEHLNYIIRNKLTSIHSNFSDWWNANASLVDTAFDDSTTETPSYMMPIDHEDSSAITKFFWNIFKILLDDE